MIAVTSDMIFCAVLASSLLGAICGIIHALARALSSLFFSLFSRICKCKKETFKRVYKHAAFSNVCDFLFVLAIGIAYVLILYSSTDGVFYPVTLAALCVSFTSANSTVLSILKTLKR